MKLLLLCAITIALSYAHPTHDIFPTEWHEFKAMHGKTYDNLFEEQLRMKVFVENNRKIQEHNEKFEQGHVSYKMKMNHFGDLMPHEFKKMMNGLKRSVHHQTKGQLYVPSNDDLPKSVDWRSKGAVTPVKNQGQCGSCWAFSATGSLEGMLFMKTGKLVSLSEQNLIDCSKSYGNNGCNGGLMEQAFAYIKDNKGIDTEMSYPYEANDGVCRFKKDTIGGTDKGSTAIEEGKEEVLKDAVAHFGPISVAIDAGQESFQFYSEGVYDEPECSSTNLDHGVLAVGYGTENGKDYWIVKNSWGTNWGEQGYIKMIRNSNNRCGVASMASFPNVN